MLQQVIHSYSLPPLLTYSWCSKMFLSFLVATLPTLSDCKFLSTTNQASDNNPCYWFSPSSSYFTHSLINHKLPGFFFTPSPITDKTRTHCNSTTTSPPSPFPSLSSALWLPQTVPSLPVFPVLSSLFWIRFHFGLYMTLYRSLSDHPLPWQLTANIYQAKLSPDPLNHTFGSGLYRCWMCMVVIEFLCLYVHICINSTLQCFGYYREMPGLIAVCKDIQLCCFNWTNINKFGFLSF